MSNDLVFVAEISGKRPGGIDKRPTERFNVLYDKAIVTNDCNGYKTEWPIISVPDDYRKWYKENFALSDKAWLAPMNRSYAIKVAKDRGYRYLVQLDDNINQLRIAYRTESGYKPSGKVQQTFKHVEKNGTIINDMINMLIEILRHTNCGMAGMSMCGASRPGAQYISENYCYSFFALDLQRVPETFQGGYEDDIEYRLKLAQMGIPCGQAQFMQYGKTSQGKNKDLSGCRKDYADAGISRGAHMRKLYGDVYKAGLRSRGNSLGAKDDTEFKYFHHKLSRVKLGILVRDRAGLDEKAGALLQKYSE